MVEEEEETSQIEKVIGLIYRLKHREQGRINELQHEIEMLKLASEEQESLKFDFEILQDEKVIFEKQNAKLKKMLSEKEVLSNQETEEVKADLRRIKKENEELSERVFKLTEEVRQKEREKMDLNADLA